MKNYLNFLILTLGLFMIGTVNAQTGGINGTIVDETGTAIPGASIMIQGTSNGVVSDFDMLSFIIVFSSFLVAEMNLYWMNLFSMNFFVKL